MPPFDREGALKSAEKALRQGRIDAAIADYVRVVDAQPRDWNSANALGDLYVRAGQVDKGVTQYTRIADHLATEGFQSKAAALFKKILKIRPDDDYALVQSGELAAAQGIVADAKRYFQAVEERRRQRGDLKGAALMCIRLGTLDPEDLESRLRAAAAAAQIGDTPIALREYRDVAARLERQQRMPEALAAYQAAFDLNPGDDAVRSKLFTSYLEGGAIQQARLVAQRPDELRKVSAAFEAAGDRPTALDVLADLMDIDARDIESRRRLGQACLESGDLERGRRFLSADTAGVDAGLWMLLGELDLRTGHLNDGRAAIGRAIELDSHSSDAAVALGCRLADWSPAAGYQCVDAVSTEAAARHDFATAADALSRFTQVVPAHLVALLRLVEVSVDGGLDDVLHDAQSRLADAYLEVGRALEARIIGEDLVARDPRNKANIERYRRALTMLGEPDPEVVIAERLSGDNPFFAFDDLDLNEGVDFDEEVAVEPLPLPEPPPPAPAPTPVAPAPSAAPEGAAAAPAAPSLDDVFQGMREEVGRGPAALEAANQLTLGLTYLDMGMPDDAITALEAAARSPLERFAAGAALGRLYLEHGNPSLAVEWLDRAAQSPAPSADAARGVLYDLGAALEAADQIARARAVFTELATDAVAFRDVAERLDRLSKRRARG